MLERLPQLLLVLVAVGAFASGWVALSAPDTSAAIAVLQLVLVLAALAIYALGLTRIRMEAGRGAVVSPTQAASFALGAGALVLALSQPVDEVTDILFTAHMAQHLVLMLIVPPLLIWGRPVLVGVWAISPENRKWFAASRLARGTTALVKAIMQPLIVATLFLGAFMFWHLPQVYAWGRESEWAHVLEHLSFVITALMFWSLVLEPSGKRRMGYLATMLYVASVAVFLGLPGALMLLSPVPLYQAHGDATLAWGLTSMEDQQVAGLIMWVPDGVFFLAPIAWLFIKALQPPERRRGLAHLIALLLMFALPAILSGCSKARTSVNNHADAKSLNGQYGCGTCHTIPGADGATGRVGPPLAGIADRVFIAGMLRNNRDNMTRWISDPQSVAPGNAMPSMRIKPDDAQTIAEYLETLRQAD